MKGKYRWANHFFNFLAVILGVYLGFYMNERAKVKQDRSESVAWMNALVSDLSDDIETYESYQIPVNAQLRENVEGLLNSLIADSLDGVDDRLSTILQVENYASTTSTYSSMKSTGKLNLIDDLGLQKALIYHYEGLAMEAQKKGEYQVDYFTKELLSWLANHFDLMKVEIQRKEDAVILRNKLLIYESLLSQKVEAYQQVVEDGKKLKLRIETELN